MLDVQIPAADIRRFEMPVNSKNVARCSRRQLSADHGTDIRIAIERIAAGREDWTGRTPIETASSKIYRASHNIATARSDASAACSRDDIDAAGGSIIDTLLCQKCVEADHLVNDASSRPDHSLFPCHSHPKPNLSAEQSSCDYRHKDR